MQIEVVCPRVDEEHLRKGIMQGFLSFIQSSIMHHNNPDGALGLAAIKKWAAKSFQSVNPVSIDKSRLQRQIEELSAKLENTQMQVVSEHRKTV